MKLICIASVFLGTLGSLAAELQPVNQEERAWRRHLMPLPHEITIGGKLVVRPDQLAVKLGSDPGDIESTAVARLQTLLKEKTGASPSGDEFRIVIGVLDGEGCLAGKPVENAERLRTLPNSRQAYLIQPRGDDELVVAGLHERGVFYGVMTLCQLLEPGMKPGSVSTPIATVVDWPDFDERGQWNASFDASRLASLKLNFMRLRGRVRFAKAGSKARFAFDTKTMELLRTKAFSPVLGTTHLNFLNRQNQGRLFEVCPELAGKGDRARQRLNPHPDHHVPCATHPLFRQFLADIMMDAASQGVRDFEVWLTEFTSQCECKECLRVGQMRAEVDAVLAAWRQARGAYPDFALRIFLSLLGEYQETYEYLMSLPPEVKFGYVYGNLKILADCARAGRWVGAWHVKAGNHIADIRNHLKQLHEGRWQAAYGYAGKEFGIAAVAEWSWNVNGRSEREFLLAWATRQGYDNAEKVADWFELIGPLAGYQYRSRYTMRAIVQRIKTRALPVHPFPTIRSFDDKIDGAKKAAAMAESLARTEWIAKARATVAYYLLLKSIDQLSGRISGVDLSNEEARKELRTALADFLEKVDENIEASGGKTEFGQTWSHGISAEVKALLGVHSKTELDLFGLAESHRREKNYAAAHRTYDDILARPELSRNYRVYARFSQAAVCREEGDCEREREIYSEILRIPKLSDNDRMRARRGIADTYRRERKYDRARRLYRTLLDEVAGSANPHEVHRLELTDRLDAIEGLADGDAERPSRRERRVAWVNRPQQALYVSPDGDDADAGTKDSPFATIGRAQAEVRRIKKDKGLPDGGIAVYLRGGRYFVAKSIVLEAADSGTEGCPIVYRSYPGETARLIGGRPVDNFALLKDPDVLRRLPEEAHGQVWVADLKDAGITQYGKLLHRGTRARKTKGALELIYNGTMMHLARWPNDGWVKVAALVKPEGDGLRRGAPYQKGLFIYAGDRPQRWVGEDEVWVKKYEHKGPYILTHAKVASLDTEKRIIRTVPKHLVCKDDPYFVYNVLGELDRPGEWYLDRNRGRLYFWPPGAIAGSETVVTTLDAPILRLKDACHVVFYRLTLEGTWRHAIEITGGENDLIAGSVIRHTGQWAVRIAGGRRHGVVGCDIHDPGQGGIALEGGDRTTLTPSGHYAENNHIYRFNRFCGSANNVALIARGVGQRVSHNLIHDSPAVAAMMYGNNHVVEFNEIHDVVHSHRELGAIYTWDCGKDAPLTYRGNIIRHNFLHHITPHCSPNETHGCRGLHIDGVSANLTIVGNIFFRIMGSIATCAPDTRIENNVFVSCLPGITQGNRSGILETRAGHKDMYTGALAGEGGALTSFGQATVRALKQLNYQRPPWSTRYPQLVNILARENKPMGWPRGITIERNVSHQGWFLRIASGIRDDNSVRNNWMGQTGEDPLFEDIAQRNFAVRTGSPVYGAIGFEPIPMRNIGLYEDALRASWPVQREAGKYYRPTGRRRQGAPKEHAVQRRSAPITVDGRLQEDEWLGLDAAKAIVIDRYYTKEQNQACPKSYAWMLYDETHLYIGLRHEADPPTDGPPDFTPRQEISLEGQASADTRTWWLDDLPTGPIFVLNGYPDRFEVMDLFNPPEQLMKALQEGIEYRAEMADRRQQAWSAEWKIPLAPLNIRPEEVEKTGFNVGVRRRKAWTGWVYTGAQICKLEGGGLIRFVK